MIPDDIVGLPSTHIYEHLAVVPSEILYEAEIDQGTAYRCVRPLIAIYLCPPMWVYLASTGIGQFIDYFSCDEVCCWVRKEYSTRNYVRVYSNRIQVNQPKVRYFGCFGCGSWNADDITVHQFDRGAFGFRRIPLTYHNLAICCPEYGKCFCCCV